MRWGIDGRTLQDHFPGIGVYTYSLVRHLAALAPDDELILLVLEGAQNSRFGLDHLARLGNVRLASVEASAFGARQQWQIPRVLAQAQVDLYHSPYYLLPYRVGRPTLVTIHDLIPWVLPDALPKPALATVYRACVRLAARRADHVIADSRATRDDLVQRLGMQAADVSTIPLAAGSRFRPVDASKLLGRLGLQTPYLLYMGSNKPHKNLVRLVRSWARVPTAVRGRVQLVFGGFEDPRYPEARQMVATLGLGASVRWLGAVDNEDLPALYSGALGAVNPSLYEGFGLPVLEAMACGTPVACARTSSLIEVAGDAALTFDPRDESEMAATIGRLCNDSDLRRELARRGLERAAGYSWEATARQTLALYRRLTGGQERG